MKIIEKFENFQLFENTYLNNITSSIHIYNDFTKKMSKHFNKEIIKVNVIYGDSFKFIMSDNTETILSFDEVKQTLYK